MNHLSKHLIFVILMVFMATTTFAVTQSIEGVVKDQTGAVIPGVKISLTNVQTGATRESLSDDYGHYLFQRIPLGAYELKSELEGFLPVKIVGIQIKAGDRLNFPIVMTVGAMSSAVEVMANSSPVNTTTSYIDGVDEKRRGLSFNGRNPLSGNRWIRDFNTETYDRIYENSFQDPWQTPLSTFSIDVDTASYSNVRRFLNNGSLPPKDAVRVEELINYFNYHYDSPADKKPFQAHTDVFQCPWNRDHRLLRIGLKAKEIHRSQRPVGNFIFLLDVSGSMSSSNKLPLVKKAFSLLVNQLNDRDRVAIVVYAGASGLVLASTTCDKKTIILDALDRLHAGGSTNGGQGLRLAYKKAEENFIPDGINRVILATDGDFNVGITNQGDLIRFVEEKAEKGIFFTVLGFGMGNYKDSTLEKLADKGNGNYAYIDTFNEARKIFFDQLSGTLVTIAKDVKMQIEFNPLRVLAYRLIGYENRLLKDEDFNDDAKDAGEIGSGHTVTAFYEIVPAGKQIEIPKTDGLKYQKPGKATRAARKNELATLKIRYKKPDGKKSRKLVFTIRDDDLSFAQATDDSKFAAAVAAFGLILRDSEYKGDASLDTIMQLAREGKGSDEYGYRAEFITLVRNAQALMTQAHTGR